MQFSSFFKQATGLPKGPYDYQRRMAEEPWSEVLEVPTGMGKTAGIVLAWLYKRRIQKDTSTPRRLVYCLPMRVLVEQTERNTRSWLESLNLLGEVGQGLVSVHLLMGGEPDTKSWADYPEEDMIILGTQDMLLSRALMRGYGMSRYQWPVHFALLHNDALWVFDEVQLMGAGLVTSAQLDAFRHSFLLSRGSRSLWVSATLNRDWLATVDMKSRLPTLTSLTISDEDRVQAGERLKAIKTVERATVLLTREAENKNGLESYLNNLCELVLARHTPGTQTLIVLNRVDRAQGLFRRLRQRRGDRQDLLIHARFRARERAEQATRLSETGTDRIIVATQAIEAGVDISARLLVTELAPWSSLVQRFGRCNRYGEHNSGGGADILWVDIEIDADALPYRSEQLLSGRERLASLVSASPDDLPRTEEERPLTAVLRRKDLLDLFNTDPDLSGFDVDVSDYIRDSGVPGLQVFWRDFKDDPNTPEPQAKPDRAELCPISIGQAKELSKRKDVVRWYWDALDSRWVKQDRDPRPGMILLLQASAGGYDSALGFDAGLKIPPVAVIPIAKAEAEAAFGDDWRSHQDKPIALTAHLEHVADQARQLCSAVDEAVNASSVIRAARWHDLGKAHAVFQRTMHGDDSAPPPYLAKSTRKARHVRSFFRHELASMLAWLAQHDQELDADLIAYLILAHHGKVRMSLRAMPTEGAYKGVKRFARGVWEGDVLPPLAFDGENSDEVVLKLALMEIGEGEQGPSWTERALKLLDRYGPFQLAWLETLVRLADWRASAIEQEGENHE